MRRVFADSLYWIAISHPKDQWHAAALLAGKAIRGAEIVTTDEVLSEFLTAFRRDTQLRTAAALQVKSLFDDPLVAHGLIDVALARIPTDRFGANRFGLVGSSEAGFSGANCVQGVSLLPNW
jgi:hypothetical protein